LIRPIASSPSTPACSSSLSKASNPLLLRPACSMSRDFHGSNSKFTPACWVSTGRRHRRCAREAPPRCSTAWPATCPSSRRADPATMISGQPCRLSSDEPQRPRPCDGCGPDKPRSPKYRYPHYPRPRSSEMRQRVAESCYLRYPHVARDLITFAAEDDVWLASLSEAADDRGTRAWRLTADQAPVLHPRLNPSATHVAWTSTRDGSQSLSRAAPREAYAVSADGGPVSRLTYWGDRFATVRGWVSDNEVLVLSRTGQHASMKTWAFAVPLSGPARRLDYGPRGDRRALLRAPGRHGPAPPHRSRPVLRPARDDRQAARGLPAGRGDLAARVARRRAGAPGHTAQRSPLRAGPLSGVREVAAGLVRA
jgi:hypothetical protein